MPIQNGRRGSGGSASLVQAWTAPARPHWRVGTRQQGLGRPTYCMSEKERELHCGGGGGGHKQHWN